MERREDREEQCTGGRQHLMACWVSSLLCLQPKEEAINNAMSNTGLSFPQTIRSRTRSRRGQRTKEGYLDIGSQDTHLREQRCSALFKHLKDYYLNVYCVQLQKENCVCQVEISREESKIFYSDGGGHLYVMNAGPCETAEEVEGQCWPLLNIEDTSEELEFTVSKSGVHGDFQAKVIVLVYCLAINKNRLYRSL